MDIFNSLLNSTEITTETALFRLVLSFIAGALIGIERETHRQPAGLKTHMLICLGSTLAMLLSIYIPQTYQNFQNGDPGRIAAQVISGIGFIGAGAILKMGLNVRGLTTASSIWVIAVIGLSIGAGMYLMAFITVALSLIVLIVMEFLEKLFFTPINFKIISVKTQHAEKEEEIRKLLKKNHLRIIEANVTYTLHEGHHFHYKIGSSSKMDWLDLSKQLIKKIDGITGLDIHDPKI